MLVSRRLHHHRAGCKSTGVAPSGENHPKPPPPPQPNQWPLQAVRLNILSTNKGQRWYPNWAGAMLWATPKRFGSSRQEMKGKMVVKWFLLMTHEASWHSEQRNLDLVPQLVLAWVCFWCHPFYPDSICGNNNVVALTQSCKMSQVSVFNEVHFLI